MILGMAVFGSSIALANVPDGNTIHGCRKNSGGALRVVDPGANQKCASNETALDWSTWNFRGAWSSATAYKKGDVVTFYGSSLIATADIPIGGADAWSLIAQAGAPGKPGPAGPTGPAGAAGAAGAAGPKGTSHVYEARCADCGQETAHDNEPKYTVLKENLPSGKYAITAHATVVNYQVFDAVHVYCGLFNGSKEVDESTVYLVSAGLGTVQDQVVVQASGSFSGQVSLQCWADDSWHVRASVITAISVDNVTTTSSN